MTLGKAFKILDSKLLPVVGDANRLLFKVCLSCLDFRLGVVADK